MFASHDALAADPLAHGGPSAARWFSEGEVRALDNWAPAANIEIGVQFDFFRASAFGFIQQTEAFLRVFGADGVRYLSR